MNVSMTGTGILAVLLIWVLQYFGIVVDANELTATVVKATEVLAYVLVVYGQLRRKDLVGGLLRK